MKDYTNISRKSTKLTTMPRKEKEGYEYTMAEDQKNIEQRAVISTVTNHRKWYSGVTDMWSRESPLCGALLMMNRHWMRIPNETQTYTHRNAPY